MYVVKKDLDSVLTEQDNVEGSIDTLACINSTNLLAITNLKLTTISAALMIQDINFEKTPQSILRVDGYCYLMRRLEQTSEILNSCRHLIESEDFDDRRDEFEVAKQALEKRGWIRGPFSLVKILALPSKNNRLI